MKDHIVVTVLAAILLSSPFALASSIYPEVTEKNVISGADGSYAVEEKGSGDEIRVLEAKEITALDDQKLVDAYMDVAVELEASKVFHATSGFSPKDYKRYKELLKYRMQLVFEIHRRKLEVPPSVN